MEVYFRQKEARVGRGHILPRLQGLEVEREGTCSTSKNTVAELASTHHSILSHRFPFVWERFG